MTATLWKIVDEKGVRVQDKVCKAGGFISLKDAEEYLAKHPRSKLFKNARIVAYELDIY